MQEQIYFTSIHSKSLEEIRKHFRKTTPHLEMHPIFKVLLKMNAVFEDYLYSYANLYWDRFSKTKMSSEENKIAFFSRNYSICRLILNLYMAIISERYSTSSNYEKRKFKELHKQITLGDSLAEIIVPEVLGSHFEFLKFFDIDMLELERELAKLKEMRARSKNKNLLKDDSLSKKQKIAVIKLMIYESLSYKKAAEQYFRLTFGNGNAKMTEYNFAQNCYRWRRRHKEEYGSLVAKFELEKSNSV